MSEPAKKDDPEHGGVKKRSLVQTLLVVAGAMLAVYLFIVFTGFSVPMIVDGAGQTVGETGKALSRFGAQEKTLARGISHFSSGARDVLVQILTIVLVLVLLKLAVDLFRGGKKKDDGGHPPGGH
jgi:hypothetical protein